MAERFLLVLPPFSGYARTSVDTGSNATSSVVRRVAMAFDFLLEKSSIPVQGSLISFLFVFTIFLLLMKYCLFSVNGDGHR